MLRTSGIQRSWSESVFDVGTGQFHLWCSVIRKS